VKILDSLFSNAIFAPELVSLRAVLCVTIGYDVSTMTAPDDEHLSHFVKGKIFLVTFNVNVARF